MKKTSKEDLTQPRLRLDPFDNQAGSLEELQFKYRETWSEKEAEDYFTHV